MQDKASEAEACFHKAREIARQQAARSLELRACTSLARLWRTQNRQPEARQVLSEIYAWFTEGFDTADLKDAQSLLSELSCNPNAHNAQIVRA
jgi:adenylate cyclase